MWQWLKHFLGRGRRSLKKDEVIQRVAYHEGYDYGWKHRDYISDHPENYIPYKYGTKKAEEWMEGYLAGRASIRKGERWQSIR